MLLWGLLRAEQLVRRLSPARRLPALLGSCQAYTVTSQTFVPAIEHLRAYMLLQLDAQAYNGRLG